MRPTEDGVYTDVAREDYDRIDRANWSTIKHLKRSGAHYRAALTKRIEADTDAMRVGRATHVASLEPEKFRSQYAIWDGGTRRGKLWDAFEAKAEAAGLEILREDDYQLVTALSEAVRTNECAAKYLRGGSAEVTVLWTDADTGIRCKARLDFGANAVAIADLKTTKDASPEAFARQSWNLGYGTQAAFYRDGYFAATGQRLPYVVVAVEKEAPHVVQVFRVPESLLQLGRDEYLALLIQLKRCRETNHWPAYADGEIELELPRWLRADNDVTGAIGLVFEEESANG